MFVAVISVDLEPAVDRVRTALRVDPDTIPLARREVGQQLVTRRTDRRDERERCLDRPVVVEPLRPDRFVIPLDHRVVIGDEPADPGRGHGLAVGEVMHDLAGRPAGRPVTIEVGLRRALDGRGDLVEAGRVPDQERSRSSDVWVTLSPPDTVDRASRPDPDSLPGRLAALSQTRAAMSRRSTPERIDEARELPLASASSERGRRRNWPTPGFAAWEEGRPRTALSAAMRTGRLAGTFDHRAARDAPAGSVRSLRRPARRPGLRPLWAGSATPLGDRSGNPCTMGHRAPQEPVEPSAERSPHGWRILLRMAVEVRQAQARNAGRGDPRRGGGLVAVLIQPVPPCGLRENRRANDPR